MPDGGEMSEKDVEDGQLSTRFYQVLSLTERFRLHACEQVRMRHALSQLHQSVEQTLPTLAALLSLECGVVLAEDGFVQTALKGCDGMVEDHFALLRQVCTRRRLRPSKHVLLQQLP